MRVKNRTRTNPGIASSQIQATGRSTDLTVYAKVACISRLQKTRAALEAEIKANRPVSILLAPDSEHTSNSAAQFMIAAYRTSRVRQILLSEIDEITRSEADNILSALRNSEAAQSGQSDYNVCIVGTGWSGVVTAAKLQRLQPGIRILMVDDNAVRGGSFRDCGIDYMFNSPATGKNSGLPGEFDGPNFLGSDVLVQISDLSDELYPAKSAAAETFAIDGYAVAPAIPETKVTDIHVTGDPRIPYKVGLADLRTGQSYGLYARAVVLATGQGEPKWGFDILHPETNQAIKNNPGRIYSNDAFRERLANMSAEEILQLVRNGLAFGGGRDGTNTAIRHIITQLREILPDEEIKQFPIRIYGAYYQSAGDFSEIMGTHVYDDLLPFIGNTMIPIGTKVLGLFDSPLGIGLRLDNSENAVAGTFCASAGYSDEPLQSLVNSISGNPRPSILEDVYGTGVLDGEIIARQVIGQDIFVVGVAARVKKPKRNGKSLRSFGRAIRKHAPRVLEASEIVNQALLRQFANKSIPFAQHSAYRQPVVIVTGPNGVGKGTIGRLLASDPTLHLEKFVRHTSRSKGLGEADGSDYHFVSQIEFNRMQARDKFLHIISKPFGSYGESWDQLDDIIQSGNIPLFELAYDSAIGLAHALKKLGISYTSIFITPKMIASTEDIEACIDILKDRIESRGRGETASELEHRLSSARDWLSLIPPDLHVVVNEDGRVATAAERARRIILNLQPV